MDDGDPSNLKVLGAGILALSLVGVGMLWYFSEGRVAERAHDDAVARWEAHEPSAYAFTYSACSGMCAECTLRVPVRNGEAVDVVRNRNGCAGFGAGAAHPTVEDVFAMEKAARRYESTDSFEIVYNATFGYPESIEINCPYGWSDCGSGYWITDFEVVAPRD